MGLLNYFKAKGKKDEGKPSTSHEPPTWSLPTTDAPACPRSYKDNCYWRNFTLTSVKIFQRKGEEIIRKILAIWGKKFCVKYGPVVQLFEAAALRYVAENSSIPVPRVYCAFQHETITYILMDYIEGEEIGMNWASRSDEEKQNLLEQLKSIFEELHNIPHPRPGILAAADMQALYDPRFFGRGRFGFGPFANERDFNTFLRCGMQADSPWLNSDEELVTAEEKAEIRELIAFHESTPHNICFIHGDASSSNVMVKNGKVVALIDFELSGFYPEYWKYTTAINVNSNDGFWEAEVPKFLQSFPKERKMEIIRWKHFGPYGFRGEFPWA